MYRERERDRDMYTYINMCVTCCKLWLILIL